jgi:hypothetical protein
MLIARTAAASLPRLSTASASAVASGGEGAKVRPSGMPGTNTSFGSLKQIDAGVLNIGYVEAGPSGGPVVILLQILLSGLEEVVRFGRTFERYEQSPGRAGPSPTGLQRSRTSSSAPTTATRG